MIVYTTGDTDLFTIQYNMLHHLKFEQQFEHDRPLISASVYGKYLVTVGEDNMVKIWNVEFGKQLIREICFKENVRTACFVSESLDLMVCHGY